MFPTLNILLIFLIVGVTTARYSVIPKFYAQDSAIIVDTDQPPPPQIRKDHFPSAMLPYYQPVQGIPTYKIFSKIRSQNGSTSLLKNDASSRTAAVYTQEEFPRDLLEIAQKKLGLKTLDEVPSVTELAELLGTNSAAETISYIRQLTSTDQGIALMKAYIESSDYTDNVSNDKDNQIIANDEQLSTTIRSKIAENPTKAGFLERIASFLNIYSGESQQKRSTLQQQQQQQQQQQHHSIKTTPTELKNMRPLYVRSPLPYHYPIPLRPVFINRTNLNGMHMYARPYKATSSPPHINTMKSLTPAHIQQLARIANIPSKTLESFLEQKPKLAELAAKVASYPLTHHGGPDTQLLAAVHRAIENDEDLRKLLNSTNTLK